MVGHFVEDGGGSVGHDDALPGGRLHRNVVETAAGPQDGSTARQLLQAFGGDDRVPVEPDHIGIGTRPQQVLSGRTGVNPKVHPFPLQALFDPGRHRNSVRFHVDNGKRFHEATSSRYSQAGPGGPGVPWGKPLPGRSSDSRATPIRELRSGADPDIAEMWECGRRGTLLPTIPNGTSHQ